MLSLNLLCPIRHFEEKGSMPNIYEYNNIFIACFSMHVPQLKNDFEPGPGTSVEEHSLTS